MRTRFVLFAGVVETVGILPEIFAADSEVKGTGLADKKQVMREVDLTFRVKAP